MVLHAQSEDRFDVGLSESGGEFVVCFGSWHQNFQTEKDALNCFAFDLSSGCSLVIVFRGDLPVRRHEQLYRRTTGSSPPK